MSGCRYGSRLVPTVRGGRTEAVVRRAGRICVRRPARAPDMSVTTEAATTRPPEDLLAAYRPPAGVVDEMLDESGQVRPAWRRLVASLEQIGSDGLAKQTEQARRLLRDNGVTYNVFGESSGEDRPWELDCVPMLLTSGEWNRNQRRAHATRRLAEPDTRRSLRPPRLAAARRVAGDIVLGILRVFVAVVATCGCQTIATCIVRGPSRPWQRRQLDGRRRSHPRTVRRRLRARKIGS